MESVVQVLAFILPIIAFLSVVLVLFVNLYLNIRRRFPARVNCWFCNQWTKVQYDEQNCFECPTCLQYNGFGPDGDYNKPIPAQQDELLNQQLPASKTTNTYSASNSNGLCHLCNNNQQLKVYQLANFIPLNEVNYDVEIEHFQKQLEKAYKLCPPCETVVKTTLNKQSCLLGLKLTQLRKKGLLLLDLNSSNNGITKQAKWNFLKTLLRYTLIAFAVLNLVCVLTRTDLSDRNIKNSTPKFISVNLLRIKDFCFMVAHNSRAVFNRFLNLSGFAALSENISVIRKTFINKFLEVPLVETALLHVNSTLVTFSKFAEPYTMPHLPKVENADLLCFVGLLLQGISVVLNDARISFKRHFFHLAIWTALGYVQWSNPSKKYSHLNSIQVLANTIIITSMIFAKSPKKFKKRKLKRISKSSKKLHQLGEFSDNEESCNVNSGNSTIKSEHCFVTNTAAPKSPIKPVFGQPASIEDRLTQNPFYDARSTITAKESLNQSFTSAKTNISDRMSLPETASIFSSSFMDHSPPKNNINKDVDIDISLNKLHLGSPIIIKKTPTHNFHVNNDVTRPRPVISPAKLKNVTQNSWVAGGFWRDANGILMPLSTYPNLSRSSSQTSGFASLEPNHYNSLPSSVNNSFCGDIDCNSALSEPPYYMMQRRNLNSGHFNTHGTFYPVLNHQQLVYFTPFGFPNAYHNANPPNRLNRSFENVIGSVNPDKNKAYKPGSLLNEWMDS